MTDETSTFVDANFDHPNDRITGYAIHGGYFSVPIFSQMDENLWQGGTPAYHQELANFFDRILCLYPWEPYFTDNDVEVMKVELYDDVNQTFELIESLADTVNTWLDEGHKVLVHCQAGLNRSALVTAVALMKRTGISGAEVIKMMREKRGTNEVLCNGAFRKYVLNYKEANELSDSV